MNLRLIKLIIFLCFLLQSCNSKDKKAREDLAFEEVANYEDRFEGIRTNLLQKEVFFIDSISGLKEHFTSGGILFYYSGYDCNTCIMKGIESIKLLNEMGVAVEVISFQTSVSQDQSYYDYQNRIWVDQEDFLHSNFKFIPTPFFLVMDSSRQIIDLYFPTSSINQDSSRFFSRF